MADIDYQAVLADLEARRATLDAAIAGIKQLVAMGGAVTTGGAESGTPAEPAGPQIIRSDTFFGLSIVEATRKWLSMVRQPQSTPKILEALTKGGIPSPAYNTIYSVLRRQSRTAGDIVKLDHTNEWALVEWYGNRVPKRRLSAAAKDEPDSEGVEGRNEPPGE